MIRVYSTADSRARLISFDSAEPGPAPLLASSAPAALRVRERRRGALIGEARDALRWSASS